MVLSSANPTGLKDAVREISTPGSAAYHQWLTPAEFSTRFGPDPATVAATIAWLHAEHLTARYTSGFAIAVTAPARSLETAFGVTINQFRLRSGRVAYAASAPPALPSSLAPSVTAVLGLDDLTQATAAPLRPLPSAAPIRGGISSSGACGSASGLASAFGGVTADQLSSRYQIDSLLRGGLNGRGQTVGIYSLAPYSTSDVAAYKFCFGLSNPLSTVAVDGGSSLVSAEPALDVEQVATQAPGASIVTYIGPNSAVGAYDTWAAIVSANSVPVVTTSWGLCEFEAAASGELLAEDALFQQAATQGQTILAASGDAGSEGCIPSDGSDVLATIYPASDPSVTAVGGTTLGGPGSEVGWNDCQAASTIACLLDGGGASGGGISRIASRPPWQAAPLQWATVGNGCGLDCRDVPDVSADAGTPVAWYSQGSWFLAGGTSIAAPLIAGLTADTATGCQVARKGILAPLLYGLAARTGYGSAFSDISSGDNDVTRSYGGAYFQSVAGYDAVTGIGSPLAAGWTCPEVTSLSPAQAPAGTTVTVQGLGLEGATITVGGNAAAVLSSSPTSARIVVPAGSGVAVVSASSSLGAGTGTASFAYTGQGPPSGQCASRVGPTHAASGTPWVMAAMVDGGNCPGYWVATQSGQVATFGAAPFHGDLTGRTPNAAIVGMAPTVDHGGYWLQARDGGIFSYGDAQFYGSTGGLHLNAPVVAMAATPSGHGYWLVGADGGIFSFGDAAFYGSTGNLRLNRPVVGIAATPTGHGYWLVASDGGIFAFGDAAFHGSMGAAHLNKPIVGMTADPAGRGYRLVAADGGIFSFGAPYYGSLGSTPPASAITTMAPSVDGNGYYVINAAGGVWAFGDAPYFGGL